MTGIRLTLTRHAEDMLTERSIERSWLEATVLAPEFVEHDPDRPGVMRAFRRIPERGGRYLRVAYIEVDGTMRVLTAFFDRSRRPGTI